MLFTSPILKHWSFRYDVLLTMKFMLLYMYMYCDFKGDNLQYFWMHMYFMCFNRLLGQHYCQGYWRPSVKIKTCHYLSSCLKSQTLLCVILKKVRFWRICQGTELDSSILFCHKTNSLNILCYMIFLAFQNYTYIYVV